MTATTQRVDARGLNCPLPILRLKKAIQQLGQGEEVELLSTDPGSVKDVQSFCTQTGNVLVSGGQEGKDFAFRIRRG